MAADAGRPVVPRPGRRAPCVVVPEESAHGLQRKGSRFAPGVKATERWYVRASCASMRSARRSVNVWHQSPGVHHVLTILIAERREHQHFLASDPAEIENAKAEQARQPR